MKRALRLLVAVVLLAGEPAIAAPTPSEVESPLSTLCDLLYRMEQQIALLSPGPGR